MVPRHFIFISECQRIETREEGVYLPRPAPWKLSEVSTLRMVERGLGFEGGSKMEASVMCCFIDLLENRSWYVIYSGRGQGKAKEQPVGPVSAPRFSVVQVPGASVYGKCALELLGLVGHTVLNSQTTNTRHMDLLIDYHSRFLWLLCKSETISK